MTDDKRRPTPDGQLKIETRHKKWKIGFSLNLETTTNTKCVCRFGSTNELANARNEKCSVSVPDLVTMKSVGNNAGVTVQSDVIKVVVTGARQVGKSGKNQRNMN